MLNVIEKPIENAYFVNVPITFIKCYQHIRTSIAFQSLYTFCMITIAHCYKQFFNTINYDIVLVIPLSNFLCVPTYLVF